MQYAPNTAERKHFRLHRGLLVMKGTSPSDIPYPTSPCIYTIMSVII